MVFVVVVVEVVVVVVVMGLVEVAVPSVVMVEDGFRAAMTLN